MISSFRVTPRALEDLKNIGAYTRDVWGKAQCDKYLRDIDKRFHWLASHPKHGKHRTDIEDGYYSFPQGSHVIFYIIRDGGIDIIGIPHKNMDILNYFDPE